MLATWSKPRSEILLDNISDGMCGWVPPCTAALAAKWEVVYLQRHSDAQVRQWIRRCECMSE